MTQKSVASFQLTLKVFGRTVDPVRRESEHRRSGMLKVGREMKVIVEGVPDKLKAAVEQIVMIVEGKGRRPPLNLRNALSPRRRDYPKLIEEALKWLRRNGYTDIIVEQFLATNIGSR
ncbi:MAG: hypothetical protein QXT26_07285 [Thermoproteota archaeon]